MTVSILLPVKNAEKWIGATITSIINQSFQNWELICIDDHSTDQSLAVVRSFANENLKIRYFLNQGVGIISALNQGLNLASGDAITRMDADDLMPPDRLQVMVDVLAASGPRTVVTGKVSYFGDHEISPGYKKYEAWLNERIDRQDHYRHIYRECVIASPNWLCRKADLIENSIFTELVYPEDYSMTFLWYARGFTIKSIAQTTLLWREHPERTSRNSEVYDQKSFFKLKLPEFLRHEWQENKSLAILGAGRKGKLIARFLSAKNTEFTWYDLHYERYNTPLFGKTILDPETLNADLLLIAIQPEDATELFEFLGSKGFSIGQNSWLF